MQIATSSFPYALSLYNDSNRMFTLNRRMFMNENKTSNTSSIVLFRCREFANEFRDEVMLTPNFCNNTWNMSSDENSSENFKSVIFHTKKQDRNVYDRNHIIIPQPIEDFDSKEFVDKLITYNISAFFMDTYDVTKFSVNLYGHIWTPPQDVLYYTSDIEKLYNN